MSIRKIKKIRKKYWLHRCKENINTKQLRVFVPFENINDCKIYDYERTLTGPVGPMFPTMELL